LMTLIMGCLVSENASADCYMKDCEKEWGSDYQMVEFCYENQTKGLEKFYKNYKQYILTYDEIKELSQKTWDNLSPQKKIVTECISEWATENCFDMQMIVFCIENQFSAARRMGKIK
jgi:hypothetical protein